MNYESLIDEVRGFMAEGSSADPDLMSEVVEEYCEAVLKVNERLKIIGQLLSKGFTSEAIAEADKEPILVEVIGELNFAERADWEALIETLGLAPPPSLRIDIADRLDEAYVTQGSTESLLDKHRLLALTRSSLKSRCIVLRQLCEQDPGNLTWTEDLRGLEQARLKEFPQEINTAKRTKDLPLAGSLLRELTNHSWSATVSPDLKQSVQSTYQDLAQADSLAALDKVTTDLHAAFMVYDVETAKDLNEQWHALATKVTLGTDHPLSMRAAEAHRWLEEIAEDDTTNQKFEDAVDQLVHGMDKGVPLRDFERLVHSAQNFEKDLPDLVILRLNEYRQRLEWQGRVKGITYAVTTIVIAVGILVGGWWMLDASRTRNEIASAAEQIQTHLDNDDLHAAEQFVSSLSDDITSSAEIQSLIALIEVRNQKESERQSRFNDLLAAAEAAGLDEPDDATIDEAESIAANDVELTKISELRRKINRRQDKLRADREKVFYTELQDYTAKVNELDSIAVNTDSITAAENLRQELKHWTSKYHGKKNNRPIIGDAARQQIPQLENLCKSRITSLKKQLSMQKDLRQIDGKSENIDSFVNALEIFCDRYPDSGLSQGFRSSLTHAESWRSRAAWDLYLKLLLSTSTDNLQDRIPEGETLLKEHPSKLYESLLAQIREYIDRETYKKTVSLEDLRDLFPSALFETLYRVELQPLNDSADTVVYWCKTEPKKVPNKPNVVEVEFYVGEDLLTQKRGMPKGRVTSDLAPQCAFFKTHLRPVFDEATKNRSSTGVVIVNILYKLFDEDLTEGMDPILRARLIIQFKQLLSKVHPGSENTLTELDALLNDIGDLDEDWIDKANRDYADLVRDKAKRKLESLDLQWLETTNASVFAAEKPLNLVAQEFQLVGWLYKRGSNFMLRSGSSDISSGKAFTVTGKSPSPIELGTIENGTLSSAGYVRPENGMPVWMEARSGHD